MENLFSNVMQFMNAMAFEKILNDLNSLSYGNWQCQNCSLHSSFLLTGFFLRGVDLRSSTQRLDIESSKVAKLLAYAKLLAKQGEVLEKDGQSEDAIPKYIKAVDILLLLADVAPTYPEWTKYVSKAEFYQKRTRAILTNLSLKREEGEGIQNTLAKSSA